MCYQAWIIEIWVYLRAIVRLVIDSLGAQRQSLTLNDRRWELGCTREMHIYPLIKRFSVYVRYFY